MRKISNPKQALTESQCIEILERNTHGILSLNGDDGYPYGVPVNFVYSDGTVYFHTRQTGYKIDCIRRSQKVSFAVVDKNEIDQAGFTAYFRSVIISGAARITDPDEHRKGFTAFVDKYSPDIDEEKRHYMIKNCGCGPHYVIAIDIENMTGKQDAAHAE